MSRSLLVIGLVALIAMPADAGRKTKGKSAKRKGKVVRVERSRLGGAGMVRMCQQVQPDGTAYCWGKPPVEGEVLTVFDETGRRASLSVRTVTPQKDACGNDTSWIIATTAQGDISQLSYMATALADWEGEVRTKVVQPMPITGLRPGENVWTGVDDDGDDVADLVITSFSCDPTGTVSQGYQSAGAYCMSYYRREGSSYQMLRTDIVPSC